ncbi:MAG: phosphatase PAP2 family protein [Bacteroidota bacterium]
MIGPLDFNWNDYLRRLRWFLVVLLGFWGISLYWWLTLGYKGTFLWMNQVHWTWLDNADLYFFTHLGDGLILPALLVLLFWRRDPAFAITAVIAVFLCGLLAVFGKLVLFPDWHRPARVFEGLPVVEIVHPHPPKSRAFPSGHATVMAAGGVFYAWFLYRWNRGLPLVVGLFTVFLCFTRVVIGVHFPADIFIGSLLGASGAVLALKYLYPVLHPRMNKLRLGYFPMLSWIILLAMGGLIAFQFFNLLRHT